MTEPVRYCVVDIPEQSWELILDQIEGFGDVWVSGWCSEGRCVFSNDKVTAVRIVLLSRGRGFSSEDK
jgi:hypothetical protein